MKYIDLHTDALTKEGVRSVTPENLKAGGCLLECFAAFVPKGGMERALSLFDAFDEMCERGELHRFYGGETADMGAVNALLTVEGGEALEGRIENLDVLYRRGVRLLTLVWNNRNELGAPHSLMDEGLTSFGRAAVERMGEIGMLVDVSHGSDALFFDVAAWSRRTGIPFVASHSNARAVFPHPRNLSDEEIRTLSDCGGVMGLNFYDAFLASDRSLEGQRTAILAHMRHIVAVGGEDVLCFGSDFDGIPQNACMRTPLDMPRLLDDLNEIFPARIVEKIALRNAMRVFDFRPE